MAAPVRVPQLQTHAEAFPSLRIPRRRWNRSATMERALDDDVGLTRVFACETNSYRITITEASDGRLSGTLTRGAQLWLLDDHSTLLCWMAALQSLSRPT